MSEQTSNHNTELTPEEKEKLLENNRKIRKVIHFLHENFVAYMVIVVAIAFGGQILGLLFVLPGLLLYKFNILHSDFFMNLRPFCYTFWEYMMFFGVWILTIGYLMIRKQNRRIAKTFTHKTAGNNIKNLLIGLLLGGGINGLCALVAWRHGDIELSFSHFNILGFVAVFLAVFVQSSAEEIICRGYLYQRMRKTYRNPWIAIVGNALLFSALHLGNNGVTPLALLNIFVCGLFFTLFVYYFDSIWMAFAAHAAWNFMQSIILGLPNSGIVVEYTVMALNMDTVKNSFAYNVNFGVEGTILADVLLILACGLVILIGEKRGVRSVNIWQAEN